MKCIYPFEMSFLDYPDNEMHCVSVYMLGCDFTCPDCINSELRNINYNKKQVYDINITAFIQLIKIITKNNHTNKVTLIGGDPLSKDNINFTKELLSLTKTYLDYCIYTGYEMDYVKNNDVNGFEFLKCGQYISELSQVSEKTDEYISFGSSNQKLYDKDFNLISENGFYKFKQR